MIKFRKYKRKPKPYKRINIHTGMIIVRTSTKMANKAQEMIVKSLKKTDKNKHKKYLKE